MKITIAVLVILTLLSNCAQEHRSKLLQFTHLTFVAYIWQVDQDPVSHENRWHLTISSFLRADSSGACQIARRWRWEDSLSYLAGQLPIGSDTALNSLAGVQNDSNYVRYDLMPDLYHGLTYSLILEKPDHAPIVIQYNPLLYPQTFQSAYKLLPALASSLAGTNTRRFSFKPQIDLLRLYDNRRIFHFPDSVLQGPHYVSD